MKNIVIILSFLLLISLNHANAQVILDSKGEPYTTVSYTEVIGDPYLVNEWRSGFVILENNQKASATLKYDNYDNILLFQGKSGETLQLKGDFKGFTLDNTNNDLSNLNPLVFVNGFPNEGKQTPATLYQLIGDGKVKLLKYYKKNIYEHNEYASAIITRTFKSSQAYFVFSNNQLSEIQPNKKAILKLFSDHAAQSESYLKENNINFKSDADLQKLFKWYNSLN